MNNGLGSNVLDTKSDTARVRATSGVTLNDIKGIRVDIIPNGEQRYDTVGDWYFEDQLLVIKVSRFNDARATFAVAVHEVVEAILCTQFGITPEVVDHWDFGEGAGYDEPGANMSAPYHKEHLYARAVERRLINTMGLSWETYNLMEPK